MTKPIGRMWVKEDVITGYIVVGQACIKFAAAKNNADVEQEVILVYPSKNNGTAVKGGGANESI